MSLDVKTQNHLLNIIETTKDHHPNFVLFLGAGASISSGVSSASNMIAKWRIMYYEMNKKNESFKDFYKEISWYNTDQEYSILFESLYDEPSQRREFIETCLKDASPSWGYIFLVNLLAHNVFNAIFTTNFDDLINEACYTYSSNVRPIVCAHDSSITSLRITSQRPKVIKLHGDFLFDNLKNTVKELETLEKNMLDKFRQYALEFGFIFIGYSGNDRSIMDSLNLLLKNENNFPHGIYWCIKKGEQLRDNLDLVRRFPKVRLIEIDGFDDFFANLNERLGFSMQPEMSDPYAALSNKLDELFKKTRLTENKEINPIIKKHIDYLGKKIPTEIQNICSTDEKTTDIVKKNVSVPIPFSLLASIKELSGSFDEAEVLTMQQLEKNPTINSFNETLRILFKGNKREKANEVFLVLMKCEDIIRNSIDSCLDISLTCISNNEFDKAKQILEKGIDTANKYSLSYLENYFILNLYQIRQHQNNNYTYTPEEVKKLEEIEKSKELESVYGAKILLKKYKEAEDILVILKKQKDIKYMEEWPITKLFLPHLIDKSIFS